ncbi:MAG: hypothetical protein EHM89_12295 [Acidobacteria bacterium]|jgi:hypothetical protein|nr:MAG: hypothetical protein EHM89_12295 [Acidobacteriota bacterium]
MPAKFDRRIARFAAKRLFRAGVERSDREVYAQPYTPGALALMFQQDRKGISRPVAHLHQRNEAFTIDLFPPLWSAKLVAIGDHGMRLDGWEPVDDTYQRQGWHIVFG